VTPVDLVWLFVILAHVQPLLQRRVLGARRDKALILPAMSLEAQIQAQVGDFVHALLRKQMPGELAAELATTLSDGRCTHDYSIDVNLAQSVGLKVARELSYEANEMTRLYPQSHGRRPSVGYIPLPYDTSPSPEKARPSPGTRPR